MDIRGVGRQRLTLREPALDTAHSAGSPRQQDGKEEDYMLQSQGRGKAVSSEHPFWGKNASVCLSLPEARDRRKWQRWGWVWTTYIISVLSFSSIHTQ